MADIKLETWPWNLLEATGIESGQDPLDYLNDTGNVEIAIMLSNLTDREKVVIRMRYGEGKTLQEVADVLGIGRERVRQIEAKSLRKLRHPSHSGYILKYGVKAYVEKRIQDAVEARTAAIRLELDEEYDRKYSQKLTELSGEIGTLEALADFRMEKLETPIEQLDLSVRSYNCLKRASCNTIGDIIEKHPTLDDARMIRNLGRKSIEEISQKLAMFGVRWPKENEE